MIHELMTADLLQAEAGRGGSWVPTRLWASDAFGCLRRAVLKLQGAATTVDPAPTMLQAFRYGNLYEDDIVAAVVRQFGEQRVTTQLRLGDDYWSGKADLVIDHGTPTPTIVECKALNSKWWNYQDSLPKIEHVGQVCMYGHLYSKQFGVTPNLILFYRSWSDYAELMVTPHDETVAINGVMNGSKVTKILLMNVRERREVAEWVFNNRAPLPDRLTNKEDGCTFRGEPSCPMYYHCWPRQDLSPSL